jgi:mannose-6-phosphate isomerase-like protein (cupin superfamily)
MSDTKTPESLNGDQSNDNGTVDLSRQHMARVVRYAKPESTRDRRVVAFGRTDSMMAFMQVHKHSGESRLHRHPNTDAFWWVVRGRVEFYTTAHKLLAELGPEEGVLIPRDVPYYFNALGDDDLEILQVESFLRQGERLQTVFLEDDPEPTYEVTQTGEYVSSEE